jgi:hypothetical protein
MLAFLDSLCTALLARDVARIRQLLAHPLSRALPRAVRDEATSVATGAARRHRAPLEALRLYHQTAHVLGVRADPSARRPGSLDSPHRQVELPLESLVSG